MIITIIMCQQGHLERWLVTGTNGSSATQSAVTSPRLIVTFPDAEPVQLLASSEPTNLTTEEP